MLYSTEPANSFLSYFQWTSSLFSASIAAAMAVTFSDLHTEAGLKSLDAFLSGKTYISGSDLASLLLFRFHFFRLYNSFADDFDLVIFRCSEMCWRRTTLRSTPLCRRSPAIRSPTPADGTAAFRPSSLPGLFFVFVFGWIWFDCVWALWFNNCERKSLDFGT